MLNVSFIDACNSLNDDDVKSFTLALASSFDARAEYEEKKNADNSNIQKNLKKSREKFARASAARFCMTASVKSDFINRAERVNAQYNVYAVEKVADLIDAVMHKRALNAINLNVLKSLFKLTAKEIAFTHKLAVASASDKVVVEDASIRKLLSRHNVSLTTASTQASSTMNALVTCNVVTEYMTDAREVAYRLNDNSLVEALREVVK